MFRVSESRRRQTLPDLAFSTNTTNLVDWPLLKTTMVILLKLIHTVIKPDKLMKTIALYISVVVILLYGGNVTAQCPTSVTAASAPAGNSFPAAGPYCSGTNVQIGV